ncbi:MAG: hypothetical protein GXP55_17730 [Deltaproteobacteria bacterium]|nr:hypothetical protein [Deltaproteobacteria bacterium]
MSKFYSEADARDLGKGKQAPNGSVTDAELAARLRGYKRTVAGRYRALFEADFERIPGGQLLVSPKIDGELWFLVFDGGEVFLASPKGRVVFGDVPVLAEAKAAMARAHERTIVAGELFAARKSGRPRVGDLAAAMGGEAKAEVARMAFAPFDLLEGGFGEDAERPVTYAERLASIQKLFEGGKRVRTVRTEEVEGGAAVASLFEEWVAGGKGEGLVVRTADDAFVYKVKPTIDVDAVVVGYTESSEGDNKVGSFLLALMREDGQLQLIGSCGNMPTQQRLEFMRQVREMHVDSGYRHANSKGALYRFIRPEIILEVRLTDVQSETSAGDPIRRMVLDYVDDAYKPLRQLPGVSILHPVFMRVREDKSVNPTDLRVAQVLERCLVDSLDEHAEPLDLPPSELIRREVYTKTTKGAVAVRKLVLWKTNKQDVDPSYPAYVVHFTDYSAGRKDPLKREVRVAPSEELATGIAEAMLEKNIKKGWALVEG